MAKKCYTSWNLCSSVRGSKIKRLPSEFLESFWRWYGAFRSKSTRNSNNNSATSRIILVYAPWRSLCSRNSGVPEFMLQKFQCAGVYAPEIPVCRSLCSRNSGVLEFMLQKFRRDKSFREHVVRINGPDILRTGSVRLQNHCFFAPFLEFLDQEKSPALIIFDRGCPNCGAFCYLRLANSHPALYNNTIQSSI